METESNGVIFILVRPDRKILLQLRDEHSKESPLQWAFPGGATDGDESKIETVLRETKEEFNISLDKEMVKFLTKFPVESNHVFICRVSQGAQPELLEGKDMRWFSMEEINQINLGFNQKYLLPIIEDYFKAYEI